MQNIRLNNGLGWCGNSQESGSNWVLIDLKAPTIIKGFKTMSVDRQDDNYAFTTAMRLQYTDDLTDAFKDYRNPDGTAVEFRILEPTLSILNLPVAIETRYIKFKVQDYVRAPCLKLEVMGCTKLECLDINECAVNNGGCDQKCVNTPSDSNCACNIGFELYTRNGSASYFIEKSENGLRDGDTYQVSLSRISIQIHSFHLFSFPSQVNKSCVPVMCPNLSAPENGLILSTQKYYHFGDLVSFQCDFGYIMSGSSSLLCTSTGVWNGSVPECKCK